MKQFYFKCYREIFPQLKTLNNHAMIAKPALAHGHISVLQPYVCANKHLMQS